MEFETKTIVTLGICGALAFIIPISVIILYKIRHKSSWGISALIGAGTFTLFAMVLEQLLHTVMLPIVQDSPVWYCVYGALAAGVFEETGRYLVMRFTMRNRLSDENAVMFGLGHGGAEVILAVGFTMFAYAGIALRVNEVGLNEVVMNLTKSDLTQVQTVVNTLEGIKDFTVVNALLTIYERFVAVIFHVCMSIWVCKAVTHKARLYPAAIAAHAGLDFFAAMYQKKLLITSEAVLYVIVTIFAAAAVVTTMNILRKYPDRAR